MSKISYHGALAPLEEACRLAGWSSISNLMSVSGSGLWRKGQIALRHLRLPSRVLQTKTPVLVRDFSNVPLRTVFSKMQSVREQVWFVINHNLQWAEGSKTEAAALKMLGKKGAQFIFFEEVPSSVLSKYEIDPSHCFSLPHPVPPNVLLRDRSGGVQTIGVVGQFRAEKGMDELLEQLKPLASTYRILIALPNRNEFQAQSKFAQDTWFELRDSQDATDYQKAISDCDVVVLNHPTKGYEYRASGLIADAAAAHVPVVVRRLPLMEKQISFPKPVGVSFTSLNELPACLEQVDQGLKADTFLFADYAQARSAQALAKQLEKICPIR